MSVKNRIGRGNSHISQRLGVNPNQQQNQQFVHTGMPTTGEDARFRLIHKKRQNITDARDRLAEITKVSDARLKLNKMKKFQPGPAKIQASSNGIQKHIGNQITTNKPRPNPFAQVGNFKTVNRPMNAPASRNIATGNKTQLKGGSLTRTVNRGPQIAKKMPTAVRKAPVNVNAERYHPLRNNPNVVTIRNDNAMFAAPQSNRRLPPLKGKRYLPMPSAAAPTSMRSSAAFPFMHSRNEPQPLMKMFRGNAYEPFRLNPFAQEFKPARLKITTANNYMEYNNRVEDDRYGMPPPAPRMQSLKRNFNEDFNDYYQSPPKRQMVPGNIVSRLDQGQRHSSTGYKVMVSNLHPMVSVDDVEELFRNVGPIKDARLLCEGIAEVIFADESDAYRSVDVYHNRHLDGQPMNVTVVKSNEMPSSLSSFPSRYSPQPQQRSRYSPPQPSQVARRSGIPFGSSQTMSRQSQMPPKSVLRAAGGSLYGGHESVISALSNKRSQKVDVSPNLSVIHHALFSGRDSNANSNSNLQVFIKLPKPPLRGSK